MYSRFLDGGGSDMKKIIILISLSFLIFSRGYADVYASSFLDIKQIENLTGLKGEFDKDSNVFKISVPRSDLKVNAAGVKLTPALGLTSWASFTPIGDEAIVMGDMVLLEDQVNSVMEEALNNGLKVTALHNHYLWDSPKIMFMHIEGKGYLKDLATAVGKVFKTIKQTSLGTIWRGPPAPIDPAKTTLNSKTIGDFLEKEGTLKDGVYKIVWGRAAQMDGHEMTGAMGVNSWAAFAGTDKEAVMLGDIAMEEKDVQNVLKTLLKHHIFVISLHQHMLGEDPRLLFVHYMGRGPAFELASALKEALEQMNPPAKKTSKQAWGSVF